MTLGTRNEFVAIQARPRILGLTGYHQVVIAEFQGFSVNGLIFSLEVGGALIPHNSQVLVYASFTDPENPGNYQSFTCTAKFTISDDPPYAEEHSVKNYYGNRPFTRGSSNSTIAELNK